MMEAEAGSVVRRIAVVVGCAAIDREPCEGLYADELAQLAIIKARLKLMGN